MKKHTAIYLQSNGYTAGEWIPCEVCGSTAVDVHHIKSRGIGGNKKADTPDNLMALCRACHIAYGDKKQHVQFLIERHTQFCERNNMQQ